MSEHDPFCKCYYPALTDPETCTWCYVIKRVRLDEYFKAWDEGFGIGYGEGYEKASKEISEASAAGTSNPPTTTQKLDTLGFFNVGTTDYMCPFCVTPWKCNGPHIDEGDMENFLLYMEDRNAESND